MLRRFLTIATLLVSSALLAQRSGTPSTSGAAPATPTATPPVSAPSLPGAVGGIGAPATQAATPTTPTVPNTPQVIGGMGANPAVQPAPGTPTVPITTTGGFIGPVGGAFLSTPMATFASPQPTAGISNAGTAGISNSSPVSTGVQSTLGSSSIVYTNMAPVNPTAAPSVASSGRLIYDLGPSFFSNTPISTPEPTVSLAEVAAQYKAKGIQSVRTITNSDVERLRQRDNSGAGNPSSGLPASDQPAPGTPAVPPPAPSTAPSGKPSPQKPPQQMSSAEYGRPSAGMEQASGEQHAQNSEPAAQETSQSSTGQGRNLPRSASPLPLLLVIGLSTTGTGLLYRKLHR